MIAVVVVSTLALVIALMIALLVVVMLGAVLALHWQMRAELRRLNAKLRRSWS